MKPAPHNAQRIWLAVAVLALAAIAGWWLSREAEPEAVHPPRLAPAGPTLPRPGRDLPPAQRASVEAPKPSVPAADLFAARTWEPPPTPAVAAEAPPPQAPPLPFRFMGRIVESGQQPVFLLAEGDRVLPVKLGERIGGAYRLEKFAGGQLYFRYQPMNLVQTLPVGGAP